jgi:Ni,Fe-hydrogenase maturation factor
VTDAKASPFSFLPMKIPSTIFIGYGNPDRQDDGLAWHILAGIAQKLGRTVPATWEEPFLNSGDFPHLVFQLQLTPEISETLSQYENICFVDAHTGDIPNDIQFGEVAGGFQTSPFTHHMTAEACLALTNSLYKARPRAFLLSVRGYSFGFSQELSPQSAFLTAIATNRAVDWIKELAS